MSGFTPEGLAVAVDLMLPQVTAIAPRQRLAEAEKAADIIGSGSDILWAPEKLQQKIARAANKPPVPGKANEIPADEVFRGIVVGVALLAHRPGGVTFGGMHWCATEHDDCTGLGEWTVPVASMTREGRGAVFTPRNLAEEVVDETLEALVYKPGPLEVSDREGWRLLPSNELLKLTVGDIAVGSGVFLVVACRYLADRLVEAWFDEAGHPRQNLPAYNPMTTAARRQVMRCLYGIDIDPLSVELARLSLALLAPLSPIDLTTHIVCGDALLGLSTEQQLIYGHLDPASSKLGPIVDPDLVRRVMRRQAYINDQAVA